MSLTRLCLLVQLATLLSIATAGTSPSDTDHKPAQPCTTAEYRQFDFFAGDWDTYDLGDPGKVIARNKVDVILAGCVVHEDYRQNDGHHGESYSLYDVAHGTWHQSWVTNRGELLLLDGGIQSGRMVLTGTERSRDGKDSLLRGVWFPQDTAVREIATRSVDGGKSWQPVFDILFRAHQG